MVINRKIALLIVYSILAGAIICATSLHLWEVDEREQEDLRTKLVLVLDKCSTLKQIKEDICPVEFDKVFEFEWQSVAFVRQRDSDPLSKKEISQGIGAKVFWPLPEHKNRLYFIHDGEVVRRIDLVKYGKVAQFVDGCGTYEEELFIYNYPRSEASFFVRSFESLTHNYQRYNLYPTCNGIPHWF